MLGIHRPFTNSERKIYNFRKEKLSIIFTILGIIFIGLFIVNYIRNTVNGNGLTFTSFLEAFTNIDTIEIPNLSNFRIDADWGIFNFFRTFINTLASLFNFGVWFSVSAANVIYIIIQFVPILLIG